jgi:hypothetical protein
MYLMERRKYQRADASVAIGVRLLPIERQSAYFSKIYEKAAVTGIGSGGDSESEGVGEALVSLQEKADSMARILSSADDAGGFQDLRYKQINISGGGVRFFCDTKCNMKDLVELMVILPVQPPIPLYVYGEVVRVLETEDGYGVAVEFIATSDEIRREIVQFVSALLDTV